MLQLTLVGSGLNVIINKLIILCEYAFADKIRKTCPCTVMYIPFIAKLGYAGVYPFFLFLLQSIDCGYSLEPPRRGG